MLNSILETRKVKNGLHNITLEINEEEYFRIYDELRDDNAFELLQNYLKYKADDGRPEDVTIKHKKHDHIVVVNADLNYTGNNKTEGFIPPTIQ